MTLRLTLPNQIALGLMVALVAGYLFQINPAMGGNQLDSEATQTPGPFVTLPGVWALRVKLHRNAAPEVENLLKLPEGRLTPSQSGDSSIYILDRSGNQRYELSFQPHFVMGEPQQSVDDITLIFVLPDIEGADRINLVTPQGETSYDFPPGE